MNYLEAIGYGIRVAGAPSIEPDAPQGERQRPSIPPNSVGVRVAMTGQSSQAFGASFGVFEPTDSETTFHRLDLTDSAMDKLPPWKLLEILVDINPELSSALWTFARSCNPGWTCSVHTSRAETAPKSKIGQDTTDAFLRVLTELYGSVDIQINRLFIGAFLRGAFYGELVLSDDHRTPIDLATPDPKKARFEPMDDRLRGRIFVLGQYIRGEFVRLDGYPTIRYIPVDPLPGKPYGRPIGAAALFTALFLLSLMRDLKRVVQQQGYPRIDIEIAIDELLKIMPPDMQQDPQAFLEWSQAVIAQIEEAYRRLQPDDAFIHLSNVKVNKNVGTVDSSSLSAVATLIAALERQCVRALKSMPLLLAVQEGTNESQANRQWEIYVAGIKALQHLCENLMEHLLQQALTAQGIVGFVRFRFAELRASELLRDAQVMQIHLQNAWNAYRYGYVDQDTAARMAVGATKADQDEPRYIDGGLATPETIEAKATTADAATDEPATVNDPGADAAVDSEEQPAAVEESDTA